LFLFIYILLFILNKNTTFRAALNISCYVQGKDEKGRMIRRTVMRYLNLAHVLVMRDISSAVKKRFPFDEQLINSGKLFIKIKCK